MFRVLLFLALFLQPVCSSSAELGLQPCEAASEMSALRLSLKPRLVSQLGMDRPPIELGGWPVFRVLVEPDYWNGHESPGEEWTVAVYLPEVGDAVVEMVRAERCIRGLNSRNDRVQDDPPSYRPALTDEEVRVPVQSAREKLPRELAIGMQARVLDMMVMTTVIGDDQTTIRLHPTTYSLMAWKEGLGTRCAKAVVFEREFAGSTIGKVVSGLSSLAQATPGSEQLQRELHELLEKF